jgi:hypothetical protein
MFMDFIADAGACVVAMGAVGAGGKVAKSLAQKRIEAQARGEQARMEKESILTQASEAVKAAFAQKSQVVPSQE